MVEIKEFLGYVGSISSPPLKLGITAVTPELAIPLMLISDLRSWFKLPSQGQVIKHNMNPPARVDLLLGAEDWKDLKKATIKYGPLVVAAIVAAHFDPDAVQDILRGLYTDPLSVPGLYIQNITAMVNNPSLLTLTVREKCGLFAVGWRFAYSMYQYVKFVRK